MFLKVKLMMFAFAGQIFQFARYELRRCVRARTRGMCSRTCACACEIHSEKCAECECVRLVFVCVMCDPTFAHFLEQNCQKLLFFV